MPIWDAAVASPLPVGDFHWLSSMLGKISRVVGVGHARKYICTVYGMRIDLQKPPGSGRSIELASQLAKVQQDPRLEKTII